MSKTKNNSTTPVDRKTFPTPRLEFVRYERLKEHESAEPLLLNRLLSEIRSDGSLRRPIAVDLNTKIILDGHYRFKCLKLLGCNIIPCYMFDYKKSEIIVLSHRDGENITKEDVIRAGLTGNKLRPKSSKHLIKLPSGRFIHISQIGKDVNVKLETLKTQS